MYMWVRNYAPGGAQSRLKYSDNFMQAKSTWTWSVNLTNFGYPVFVQGAPGGYVYIVAHDNNSAYVPADRFVMIRVSQRQTQQSGFVRVLQWFAERSELDEELQQPRDILHRSVGSAFAPACLTIAHASGTTGGATPVTARRSKSFEVWSGEQPWGKWVRIYSTTEWDMSPGERGEFPIAWMGKEPISAAGTLHLLFSGQDQLVVRRATVAPGF